MGSCRERDAIAGALGPDQAAWFGDGDFGIVDGYSVDASGDDVYRKDLVDPSGGHRDFKCRTVLCAFTFGSISQYGPRVCVGTHGVFAVGFCPG